MYWLPIIISYGMGNRKKQLMKGQIKAAPISKSIWSVNITLANKLELHYKGTFLLLRSWPTQRNVGDILDSRLASDFHTTQLRSYYLMRNRSVIKITITLTTTSLVKMVKCCWWNHLVRSTAESRCELFWSKVINLQALTR